MPLAAIALGSNLTSTWGSPAANLHEAIRRIGQLGRTQAVSSFYATAPVGYLDQPDFVNAALLLDTHLEPAALMQALLAVEHDMGRDRANVPAKGPRIIDLDLLLYDALILTQPVTATGPALTLPHPAMTQRRFVLEPLAEIAPAMIHPSSGKTIAELLSQLTA
jgi:2-amino-4-hydroxy-6-hydroxymethyldihydropteridine diphosphokinase